LREGLFSDAPARSGIAKNVGDVEKILHVNRFHRTKGAGGRKQESSRIGTAAEGAVGAADQFACNLLLFPQTAPEFLLQKWPFAISDHRRKATEGLKIDGCLGTSGSGYLSEAG
jgi:hypothetical protein